jgi:hypothetical protein
MGHGSALGDISLATSQRLQYVEVILNVLETAVFWQAVKERANGVFGGH